MTRYRLEDELEGFDDPVVEASVGDENLLNKVIPRGDNAALVAAHGGRVGHGCGLGIALGVPEPDHEALFHVVVEHGIEDLP